MNTEIQNNKFVRVVKRKDDKGRLISYDVVEASKDPLFLHQLDEEIKKNKLEIEEEQRLENIEFKKTMDNINYLKRYSLVKLINAFNLAMIKGYIPSKNRSEIVQEVCVIACTEDEEERAKRIELLMNNEQLDLGYFKVIFDNMED